MKNALTPFFIAASIAFPASEAKASQCVMSPADRAWADKAMTVWLDYSKSRLRLADPGSPLVVLFDARCRYMTNALPGARWKATAHDGRVPLPFGGKIPAAVFAATMSDDSEANHFMVMALPSIWTQAKAASADDTGGLIGVFLHEFMHVTQSPHLQPVLKKAALRKLPAGEGDDDALQRHWQDDPVYTAVYERERDLLYQAANEPDAAKAREIARSALKLMEARQARFFVGEAAYWRAYDDIFLTMEGVGQWLNYQWQMDPRGAGLESLAAQAKARGRGRWWTQEEGLALFLVIDRFVPDWPTKAFAADPKLGIDLLREAAG